MIFLHNLNVVIVLLFCMEFHITGSLSNNAAQELNENDLRNIVFGDNNNAPDEEIGSLLRGLYTTKSDNKRIPISFGIPKHLPASHINSNSIEIDIPIGIPNPIPVPNLNQTNGPFNSFLPGPIQIKVPISKFSSSSSSLSSSSSSSSSSSFEFWKRTKAEILKKKNLKKVNEMGNKKLFQRNDVNNTQHPIFRSKVSCCTKNAKKDCTKACKKALKQACKKYKCRSSMKSRFRRECKDNCKDRFD